MRYLLTIDLLHRKALALVMGGALIVSPLPARAEWRHARGDSANSSFARVKTAPAIRPRLVHAGSIAPGANAVIGSNGKVYVGNLEGELRAFHANGDPYWMRQIAPGTGGIFAAPVVGADGSIYVVSTLHHEDTKVNESFLHKFNEFGAYIFNSRFPQSKISPFDAGATTAPPSIWSWNGTEAIIVPVVYKELFRSVRLLAFSTNRDLLANELITNRSPETTGGPDIDSGFLRPCMLFGFLFGPVFCPVADAVFTLQLPKNFAMALHPAGIPLAQVAILQDPRGGAPLVMTTDNRFDKVLYAFSPQTGFLELARNIIEKQQLVTPPVVYGKNTIVGTIKGNLTFTSPSFEELPGAGPMGTMTAAPTLLSDGSLLIVSREGTVTRLGGQLGSVHTPGGQSIASAAASCTHIYVSTTEGLFTFNTKTMQQVAAVPWSGGGLSAPVIGPSGEVYVMTLDHLWVFPGPKLGGIGSMTGCDVLAPPSQS